MKYRSKAHRSDRGPNDRQDTGRVARAWRWFSGRTIRRAERYRDLAWTPIARHGLGAVALIVLSRLFPAEGFAPFALVAGAIWLALIVRIVLIKGVDGWLRAQKRKG